jgi:succinate dehydrogenase hydrophobic anchor subunit
MGDSMFTKLFGVALSANMAFHSFVGLNYVAADYVPKVSQALLPPARVVIAAMTGILFLGLSKASLTSPGGLKAIIKGPWNGKKKDEFEY